MKMNDMHLEITKTISKTLVSVILSKYCMFIQQFDVHGWKFERCNQHDNICFNKDQCILDLFLFEIIQFIN